MNKEDAIRKLEFEKKFGSIKKFEDKSGYSSPIQLILSDIQMKLEDDVCEAVQSVGINVDKDELIKALHYDREQFAKGYKYARLQQEEERENMITWLAKFCRHIDMPEHLSDEQAEILWREKIKQQFGWINISWMAEAATEKEGDPK